MVFSHISGTKYASAILSQGWAITYELPEASSPKAPGACCHPGKAPASPKSLPKPSTHFIALALRTQFLPRAHLDLSRGKKPLILWDALSVHSAITSGNLRGMIKATFLLTASLPASQPCSCWEAWSHRSQLELYLC